VRRRQAQTRWRGAAQIVFARRGATQIVFARRGAAQTVFATLARVRESWRRASHLVETVTPIRRFARDLRERDSRGAVRREHGLCGATPPGLRPSALHPVLPLGNPPGGAGI
jgi:hypothetical protein